MLSITNYQGNASQNHSEILHPTYQDACKLKKQKITSVGEDVEKLEHLCITGGNIDSITAVKMIWLLLKKIKIELPYDSAIPLLDTHPKEMKASSQ